jgi:DNA invertase Pin-like site-specific DNA recombinase
MTLGKIDWDLPPWVGGENRSCKSQHLCTSRPGFLSGRAGTIGMPIYGYARVSTGGQELDLQLVQLRAAGCERIFCEKESGVEDDRRQLKRLLKALKRDDVVIVSALDRLTRGGPFKTLSILNEITSRGAAYRSLAEPWADTTHELGEVLAALVGYIARKTREDIIRRTTAGRERAKANGVKFGRKPKLSPAQRRQALARRAAGESQSAIARSYDVSCSTISRLEQDRASYQ